MYMGAKRAGDGCRRCHRFATDISCSLWPHSIATGRVCVICVARAARISSSTGQPSQQRRPKEFRRSIHLSDCCLRATPILALGVASQSAKSSALNHVMGGTPQLRLRALKHGQQAAQGLDASLLVALVTGRLIC